MNSTDSVHHMESDNPYFQKGNVFHVTKFVLSFGLENMENFIFNVGKWTPRFSNDISHKDMYTLIFTFEMYNTLNYM